MNLTETRFGAGKILPRFLVEQTSLPQPARSRRESRAHREPNLFGGPCPPYTQASHPRETGWHPRQGGSAAQSACGASTFLCSGQGLPGFPPPPHPKAGPPSPLSMMRLCVFAEQTSLPQPARSRRESRAHRKVSSHPRETGWRRRQGALRRKAHAEPLPSFAQGKASQAFHHHPARRPGLRLHYQ